MKAKPNASTRTKNRVREHEMILADDRAPMRIDGKMHSFFRCSECDWVGWLPLDELHQ